MIAAGMLQPVMSASGTAPAKTRTPSPRKRVTRNTTEVMRRASGPEAPLQPLVGRLLLAAEIAGQEPGGDADAADEVPER